MSARGEFNVPFIAAGVLAVVAALVFGLRTPEGGPDWIGIVMAAAGLLVVVVGVLPRFRSGAPHTG
ncbi:MAG TPA: hypothetical protein VFP13_09725 [Actinomycetota bacterium]|nr:hypothetical protein [Actinomycetota bacterium]